MKSKGRIHLVLMLVVASFIARPCAAAKKEEPLAAFRFAKIVSDNMVLQQQKPARIWGWAPAGSAITVTITEDQALAKPYFAEVITKPSKGYSVKTQYVETNAPVFQAQTLTTKAGADGKWLVEFKPMTAGFTPKYVVAKSGDAGIAIRNVLIGEIWVCAGQSNMVWSNFNDKDREVPSADFPGLRYVAWNDSWYKPLDDVRSKLRWTECSPATAERFSAVPYLYGMFLHRYLKVPVGIINVARGGTTGQTWCLRSEMDNVDNKIMKKVLADYDAETAKWDDPAAVEQMMADHAKACEAKKAEHAKKVAAAKAAGKKEPRLRLPKPPGDARSGWSPPAGLFNATVMPIRHLGVRGVLYYQGENNNFMRWTRYEYTFPKIPVSFRKAFGDDKLPFGCISQPGWGTFGMDPEVATVAEGYAIVRDIQKRALKNDPNAGMIATYPTGNSYIHPGEKLPVAKYASRWALAKIYKKPVVHTGNTYREMKKKGDRIYLFFDADPIVYNRWKHIKRNAYWQVLPCPREGNAPFKGFIIADADKRWYPAKAEHTRLDDKPCIAVWCDLVKDPAAVRYGWANWPEGNLVGRQRLPMPTFRTDDWPIPEGVSYSKEAKATSSAKLKELKATAAIQALDRKIRQKQVDISSHENELYLKKMKGDAKGLIGSKISRMEVVLDQLEKDKWLSGKVKGNAQLAERIAAVRKAVEEAKAAAAKMDTK